MQKLNVISTTAPIGATSLHELKMELERAMRARPGDAALRADYAACLRRLSAGQTGLGFALFPEYPAPIYFRCGTADLENMTSILMDRCYEVELSCAPNRILDLGAYAGYAAIYLTKWFPDAEIICVEPMSDNFRLLLLNTLPYQQITCRQAAAWRHPAVLSARTRHGGDAMVQLIAEPAPFGERIVAYSIKQLLRDADWPHVDLIKCDIVGAEAYIFADPTADWLNTLDALLIETYDDLVPGAGAYVAACFESRLFRHAQFGRKQIYERMPPLTAKGVSQPAPLWVFSPGPGLAAVMVQDVAPVPWGFFIYAGTCCQLHPNPPGDTPPACAYVVLELAGHTRLSGAIWHAGEQSAPVCFNLEIQTTAGEVRARRSHCLFDGQTRDITVEFPPLQGPHRIVLQTEMAPGQPANANAWARWLNLRLH